MPWIRIAGGVMLVAAIGAALWLIQDRFRLADIVSAANTCGKASQSETAALDPCVPLMRVQIEAARKARQCGRAIGIQDRDTAMFEIRATCLAPIKQEVAMRAAAEGNLADARSTIVTLERGQAAAILRAEARGRSSALTRNLADDAIQSAPRVLSSLGAGVVRCDAQCLRDLAGR